MTAEQTENSEPIDKKVTLPYLIYVFGLGISAIVLMVYWGYIKYHFFLAVAIGGFIQVFFRLTKRIWSNALNPEMADSKDSQNPFVRGLISTFPTIKIFVLLYVLMVVVSSLWYGLGRGIAWFF